MPGRASLYTCRHAFLALLLRVPHVLLCVNKMDLVGSTAKCSNRSARNSPPSPAGLDITDLTFIPISALEGDDVVQRSANMTWYEGASFLHHLEQIYIAADRNLIDPRLPVQWVVRPKSTSHHDYRGYAGLVAGGVFKARRRRDGRPVRIDHHGGRHRHLRRRGREAFPPMSVTIRLADDIDISRGDMICRPLNQPTVGQDLDAMVAWMTDRPVAIGDFFALKHTTRWVRAVVRDIHYRLDVNTLHRDEAATSLGLNDVGRLSLRVTQPLYYDTYRRNRQTGSFILAAEDTQCHRRRRHASRTRLSGGFS